MKLCAYIKELFSGHEFNIKNRNKVEKTMNRLIRNKKQHPLLSYLQVKSNYTKLPKNSKFTLLHIKESFEMNFRSDLQNICCVNYHFPQETHLLTHNLMVKNEQEHIKHTSVTIFTCNIFKLN